MGIIILTHGATFGARFRLFRTCFPLVKMVIFDPFRFGQISKELGGMDARFRMKSMQ